MQDSLDYTKGNVGKSSLREERHGTALAREIEKQDILGYRERDVRQPGLSRASHRSVCTMQDKK